MTGDDCSRRYIVKDVGAGVNEEAMPSGGRSRDCQGAQGSNWDGSSRGKKSQCVE
jgi:hypothetical protein